MRLVWRVVCIIEGGAAVNRTVCMSRTACCIQEQFEGVCVGDGGCIFLGQKGRRGFPPNWLHHGPNWQSAAPKNTTESARSKHHYQLMKGFRGNPHRKQLSSWLQW